MAVQNAENGVVWGHPSSWAMPPFDRAHKTSYSTLIETMCLSLPFSRYSQLFVESRRFWPTPPAFRAPVGGEPFEFRGDLWHQKTRLPGLSCGVVCVILRLAVLVELRLVTDRHRPMASTAHALHRAVKRKGCRGKDLQKRKVLSLEWKSEWVMENY